MSLALRMGFVMQVRLGAILLGGLWLGLGIILLVVGILAVSFGASPCFSNQPFCGQILPFITDVALLNNMVNSVDAGQVRTFVIGVPFALLVISWLLLAAAYHLLRFAILKDLAGVVPYAFSFTILMILGIVMFTNTIFPVYDQWRTRVIQQDPDTAVVLQRYQYEQRLTEISTAGAFIVFFSAAFTLLLVGQPVQATDRFKKRYLTYEGQCQRCGLVSTNNRPPECLLCREYVGFHVEKALEQQVQHPDGQFDLILYIEPKPGSIVRNFQLKVKPGSMLEFTDQLPRGWQRDDERSDATWLVFSAPDYINDTKKVVFSLRVRSAARRQRRLRQTYAVEVEARSDFGVGANHDVVQVPVERDPTLGERFMLWMRQRLRGANQPVSSSSEAAQASAQSGDHV